MRTVLAVGVLALFGLVQPASAQMCGGGQQAQASGGMSGGMMCGMGTQAADDPMADKPEQKQQQSGMCPCCRNMAMMRGGGMMQQHHGMPGMDPPKQQ
jgi:hypothetical protein